MSNENEKLILEVLDYLVTIQRQDTMLHMEVQDQVHKKLTTAIAALEEDIKQDRICKHKGVFSNCGNDAEEGEYYCQDHIGDSIGGG